MSKVIAVIPARGGSKGVPRKNLTEVGGVSLVGRAIKCALACKEISHVVVSTEDEEIAREAVLQGATVPFLRDAGLAEDNVPVLPVVQEVLARCDPDGRKFKAVVVLQPTNPFRTPAQVSLMVKKVLRSRRDCYVSVSPVTQHPYRMRTFLGRGEEMRAQFVCDGQSPYEQRQDLPPVYYFNGAIITVKTRSLLEQKEFYAKTLYGFEIDEISAFDIDTPLDLLVAQTIAERREGK